MIKTIIFDFDGTIADNFQVFIDCYNQIAKKIKIESIEKKDIDDLQNYHIKNLIKNFKPKWKLPLLIIGLKIMLQRRVLEMQPNKEMVNVLFELKKNYNIGILSSNSKRLINKFLKFHHLNIFDFVISERNLFSKAKALKKTLKKIKLQKDEVIYVGDEIKDIEACKETGITIISVTWGFNSKSLLSQNNSEFTINKPLEILDIIKKEQESRIKIEI